MAEDPFKRRVPVPKPRNPLLITKTYVDKIVSNAQHIPTAEERAEAKQKEHAEKLKASKARVALIQQGHQTLKERLKKRYNQELSDVAREMVQEVQDGSRRDQVLDLAYKRLYQETDRVKHFKSAKNLTEMLYERDQQKAAQGRLKGQFTKHDTEFVLGMLKDVDNYQDEQEEVKNAKRKLMKVNAHNLSAQHQEIMQQKEEERWNKMKEGFLTREEDERDRDAKAAAELRRKQQKKEYMKDLKDQLNAKMSLFDIKQRIAEAEDAKNKIFNDAKRAMKLEHKLYKEEEDKKKEKKKREIADKLVDTAAFRRAQESAVLEEAVRQAEEKAREDALIRQHDRKEAVEGFLKHYRQEMARKERGEYDTRLEGYQDRKKIDDNVERLYKEEQEKLAGRDRLEREAQHVQMHQIARRRGEEKRRRLEEINDYMNHMRGLNEEEELFQKYAQMEIEEAEAKGMNTYPMKKAALPGIECGRGPLFEGRGQIRPRYYSAVSNASEDISRLHRKVLHSDTKSRLGFML